MLTPKRTRIGRKLVAGTAAFIEDLCWYGYCRVEEVEDLRMADQPEVVERRRAGDDNRHLENASAISLSRMTSSRLADRKTP